MQNFCVKFVDTTHFLPFREAISPWFGFFRNYGYINTLDFQHFPNNLRALNNRWPAANRHSGVNQRLRSAALVHAAMNQCRRSAALIHSGMNECRRSAALIPPAGTIADGQRHTFPPKWPKTTFNRCYALYKI